MKRRTTLTVLTVLRLICVWNAAGLLSVSSQANPLSENFETGGKTAYAAANVTLSSGSWYLDEALTGVIRRATVKPAHMRREFAIRACCE